MDARVLGRAARRSDLGAAQAMRLVRERVRRDLQAVVAELRGVLALLRKRHRRDDFVAKGDAHQAFLVNTARTAGTWERIVMMATAASVPAIGRVKKGVRSPSERTSPRRRLLSTMSPSTIPSTNGATGNPWRRRKKQTTPTTSITQMSKTR